MMSPAVIVTENAPPCRLSSKAGPNPLPELFHERPLDWAGHGYLDTVMRNSASWVEAQKIEGLKLEQAPTARKFNHLSPNIAPSISVKTRALHPVVPFVR